MKLFSEAALAVGTFLIVVGCNKPPPAPAIVVLPDDADASNLSDDGPNSDLVAADGIDTNDLDATAAAEVLWNTDTGWDGGQSDAEDVAKLAKDAEEQNPFGICNDGLQLPHAGSPCTDDGAVHCSRANETSKLLWYGYNGGYTICERPFRVVCAKNSVGALVWQLSNCPSVTPECAAAGATVQTCQENSRGAHCCPEAVAGPSGDFGLCGAQEFGPKSCIPPDSSGNSGGIESCDFSDVVLKDFTSENFKNTAFSNACAKSCKDCTYILGDACPEIFSECNKCTKYPCEGSGQYCMTNLPNKPNPSCVENCEEFKLTKDYKPK